MKARDYLSQIEKLDKVIKNKLIEKEQWKAMAESTTAPLGQERVQSSGNQQKMADAVARMIEIEQEIDKYIDQLIDTRQNVIHTIEQLSADLYDVLHKKYIQLKDFQEIANEKEMTYTNVTTLHGRALNEVQKILNKTEKCDSL